MSFNQSISSAQTATALVVLAEISEAITANLSLDTVYHRIAVALTRLVQCDRVAAVKIDTEKQRVCYLVSVDGQGQLELTRIGATIPISELLTVQTMLDTRELLYLPDTKASPLWRLDVCADNIASDNNVKTFIGIPLIMQGQIVGMLFIDSYRYLPLPDDVHYALLAFARFAASAILNAQQRDELRRSEERYRVAASLTSDAVFEWTTQDEIIRWSSGIDRLLQYPPGGFLRTRDAWWNVIHPDDRDRVFAGIDHMLTTGQPFEAEYRMQRADGTYCTVLNRAMRFESGGVQRVLGAMSDLTHTYELADTLAATETRYKSLIEQVPGVVYTADSIHSQISFISNGTEELFGVSPQALVGGQSSLLNYIAPSDRLGIEEDAEDAIVICRDFDAQYRIMNRQTGSERWVHHRARLILAETGETFWLGILTDITSMKELEALKSQFVANVSHELRTPLAAIKMRAATLINYYPRLSDTQRFDMLRRIRYQADILADLVEDVLRLSKRDTTKVTNVDQIAVVDLIEVGMDVLEELQPAVEASHIPVNTAWPSDRLQTRAEVADIIRIWRNLVSNAIKYTQPPGTICVSGGYVRLDNNAKVSYTNLLADLLVIPAGITAGIWAVGIVKDTGKGIPEADQANIFTRFYRGEAARTSIPGAGLGLSLVKELVTDYGGFISFASHPGAGSTFNFWLPAIEQD